MWTDYGLMWRDVVIIGANGAPDSGFTPTRNEYRS